MSRASASSRGTKLILQAGVLNISVQMFARTADAKPATGTFVEVVDEDGVIQNHPVGNMNYDKETGLPLTEDQTAVRKYVTEYGPVVVTDDEIEDLFGLQANELTVKAFVPAKLWRDGLTFIPQSKSRPYTFRVPPKEVGKKKVPDAGSEALLQLLTDVMVSKDCVAAVDYTVRGKPRFAVLVPTPHETERDRWELVLWECSWEEEVREAKPLPQQYPVEERHIQKVATEVDDLWRESYEIPSDTRNAQIQAFADEKAASGDFSTPPETKRELRVVPTSTSLDDILGTSIDAAIAAAS